MSTLYELTGQYLLLEDMMDDPDVDEQTLLDTLEGIEGELQDKAEDYGKVIKNLEVVAAGLDEESKRLAARKKAIDTNIDRMKKALQQSMTLTGYKKLDTKLFKFSIRKNAASVVPELTDIKEFIAALEDRGIDSTDYLSYKEPTLNKTAIKEAINAGVDFSGIAYLKQSESLMIR